MSRGKEMVIVYLAI